MTIRRSASMAIESYYFIALDAAAATRRAKRICRAPNAIVLDVTAIPPADALIALPTLRRHEP